MTSTAVANTRAGWVPRLWRLACKSWPEKIRVVGLFARRAFPAIPIPVRASADLWLLARQNHLGDHLLAGDYEESELSFVRRVLRPGMVALDIGANEGLYSLFLARSVGSKGTVVAFEPSQRERQRLQVNLWINLARNVRVEGSALSAEEGDSNLFVVETGETGCNSLRPPAVQSSTRMVSVSTTTLDHYLRRNSMLRIDFMKIDVEGAEWSVLQGAKILLTTPPRPFVMIEVSDLRTRPWGYHSREIGMVLRDFGYDLFRPVAHGELVPAAMDDIEDGSYYNVIAVPHERASEISFLLVGQATRQPVNAESAVGC